MARIRSIHPGLWTDSEFVSVSRDARLLFIGLLNECDDQGAFEWKPLQLKMRLCAGDPVGADTVVTWMEELAGANIIARYSVKGTNYGAVRNFKLWQRPKKPTAVHPMPEEFRTYAGTKPNGSEPDEDVGGDGSPPPPPIEAPGSEPPNNERATVPHQFPTSGEEPPQRKEGGDKGGRKEEPPELRSVAPTKRGERLSADWRPGQAEREFASGMGLDPDQVAAKFRDYWHGKAGKDAAKADWSATWRNWCRNEPGHGPNGPTKSLRADPKAGRRAFFAQPMDGMMP